MNTFRFLPFAASGRRTAVRNSYGSALAPCGVRPSGGHPKTYVPPHKLRPNNSTQILPPPTYFGPNTSAQIVPQKTSAQILPAQYYLPKYCRPNTSHQIYRLKYFSPNTYAQILPHKELRPNTSAQHTSAQILHPKYFCLLHAIK